MLDNPEQPRAVELVTVEEGVRLSMCHAVVFHMLLCELVGAEVAEATHVQGGLPERTKDRT